MFRGVRVCYLLLGTLLLSLGACSCERSSFQSRAPILQLDLDAEPLDESEGLVDFGRIVVGTEARRAILARNLGSAPLSLSFPGALQPFSLLGGTTEFEVGIGEEKLIPVVFRPREATDQPVEQILRIETNEAGGTSRRSLLLRGQGLDAAVVCEPARLDFGSVLQGATRSLGARCTNLLTIPIEVHDWSLESFSRVSFSVRLEGHVGEPLSLAPDEGVEVEISMRAETVGPSDATLVFRGAADRVLAKLPLTGRTVLSQVEIDPASCLSFGYVPLGESSQRSLRLRNWGSQSVTIGAAAFSAGEAEAFSLTTDLPLELEAYAEGGQPAELEIEFRPTREGSFTTTLTLQTDEGSGAPLVACATGFGGGPTLECSAAVVDFGAVAVGGPASASLRCTNVGGVPAVGSVDPLLVTSLASSSEHFRASIRNPDGSTSARPSGYASGESFLLEVIYDPLDEGFHEAAILLETNTNSHRVEVAGQGRVLPPCEFSILPPSLQFGVVERGGERTREFELQNHLETACLIRDLRLSDDSDPAYSLLLPPGTIELPGGASLMVPVRLSPGEYAPSLRGKVQFEISNPERRFQEVPLVGSSSRTCLYLDPEEIDFGGVGQGCSPLGRPIVMSNVCGTPLTITSLDIVGALGQEDFQIQQRPVLPLILQPHQWTETTLAFAPSLQGNRRAVLEVHTEGAADEAVYVADLRGEDMVGERQTDEFTYRSPIVDILWVIDNSGSMGSSQEQLKHNLPAFLTVAERQGFDFQLGVTTTALRSAGGGCPGGADGGENGRLFPVDGSHPRILRPDTPDLEAHWRHNIAVGTCFGPHEESAMEGAFRALSMPLIAETKDSRYPTSGYQDGNAGFLRPHASLAIILVSDTLDFSPQTVPSYAQFFLDLKRGNADLVRVHGITGPRTGVSGCSAARGDRMIDLVEMMGGAWMSLCTPTHDTDAWTKGLRAMSGEVFRSMQRLALRGNPGPTSGDGNLGEDDLEVRVNGELLPPVDPASGLENWVYNPLSNSVDLSRDFIPKVNAKITVSYRPTCH